MYRKYLCRIRPTTDYLAFSDKFDSDGDLEVAIKTVEKGHVTRAAIFLKEPQVRDLRDRLNGILHEIETDPKPVRWEDAESLS